MPQRTSDSVWWQNTYGRLEKITAEIQEIQSAQYSEPEYGFWSLIKEIALMYWIWPFLTIACRHFKEFYYIDLFAGSGLIKAEDYYFPGSPLVAMACTLPDKQFKEYLCFEINHDRKETLERRVTIASKRWKTSTPHVSETDCNKELPIALNKICKREWSCYLAFVDPEGPKDLHWKTISAMLTHTRGDAIINFPTMGIVRNLPNAKRNQKFGETFTMFFGDQGWKDIGPDPDDAVEYYMMKIAQASKFPKKVDSLSIRDESSKRLYDLIFVTGSTGMFNALQDLKARLEPIRTKDIRIMKQVLADSQTQLLNWQDSD
jgi:three-Cys-motif partner protein